MDEEGNVDYFGFSEPKDSDDLDEE